MAEILSQNEIDELLSALAAGEQPPEGPAEEKELGQIKPYDFRTANKFPKEQMRMLQFIYENFAGHLSSYLSGTLRVMSEVDILSIEEQTFSEFSNSIAPPVVLAIVNMPPLQGSALMELSSAIAYEMVSRLFGGSAAFADTSKAFTEIELSVLRRISQQILELMEEAWEQVVPIKAVLERIETSAQYTQVVASNEPIVIVTMNVKIGDVEDVINVCIPHVSIQPIIKKLSMQSIYATAAPQEEDHDHPPTLTPRLTDVQLTLHARFDETVGTVQDVIGLQVGDVIRVDHGVQKPLTLTVEHMPKFKATIGTYRSKYAVRIVDILKEERDDE